MLASAGLAPGLRGQWDDFFAKAAAGVLGSLQPKPNPIPAPAAAPALPKPPVVPAGPPMPSPAQMAANKVRIGQAQRAQDASNPQLRPLDGSPLGGGPGPGPVGISSGWHFGDSMSDGLAEAGRRSAQQARQAGLGTGRPYRGGDGGLVGDLGHTLAGVPALPRQLPPGYQEAADHQLTKLAPVAALGTGLAALPGGVVATGGAAARAAGGTAAAAAGPVGKWFAREAPTVGLWEAGGQGFRQLDGTAARETAEHESTMQANQATLSAEQARLAKIQQIDPGHPTATTQPAESPAGTEGAGTVMREGAGTVLRGGSTDRPGRPW